MRHVAAKFLPRLLTGAQKITVSQSVRSCLIVPLPPYFQDMTPADFFLFPKLKSSIKGRRFQTVEENSTRDLRTIPQNTFQDAFQNWKKTLGAVYQERRGVLWRRQIWLSCMWSSKLKKKFVFFMDCPRITIMFLIISFHLHSFPSFNYVLNS